MRDLKKASKDDRGKSFANRPQIVLYFEYQKKIESWIVF